MKPDSLFAQRLIVAVALVVLGIAAILNYVQEHVRVFNREQDRLQTQAHVIEENLNQSLLALNGVLEDIRQQLPASEPVRDVNRYLKTLSDGMPSVRTLAVLDVNGYAIAASRPELVGAQLIGPDYNQRAEFQLSRHADTDTVYVSPPFRSTLGAFVIAVSRAWTDSRGQFSGIVIATLDRDYFAPLLDSIRYAPDMKVALVHWDGGVFLAEPEKNGLADANLLRQGSFFAEHRQSGRDITVLPHVRISQSDARMMIQRTIKPVGLKMDKPLVVEIDRSVEEIYARWRRDARLFAALYTLILMVSLFVLHAYQRKQKEADLREAAAAQRIEASERFMKTITDHLPAMVAYWTDELRCRFANGAYLEWFGKAPQELIGTRIQDLLGEELFRKNEPYIRAALRGERQQFERTLTKADGSTGYTWAQYIPDRQGGAVHGFFVLVSDVTPLKDAERALAESEWKLRTIIETEPECVTLLAADGTVQQMNPAGLTMIGAASERQLTGTNLGRMIDAQYQPAFNTLLANVSEGKSGTLTFELAGLTGIHRWLECHAVPMRDRNDRITGSLCVMRDITDRKKAEQELQHLAQTDSLTGLANRRHFMALAEQELEHCSRYGSALAVLMADIDRFKKINDTHGHKCGDAVIRRMAELCRKTLRSADVVGRLGGEEFSVLLPETDLRQAAEVAELLRQRIGQAEVHTDSGEAIRFTVSIGVAGRTDKNADIETLLAQADEALYAAKNSGRNKVCEYQGAFAGDGENGAAQSKL